MNEVVKQKILTMIRARKNKGFSRVNGESARAKEVTEEISFLVHEMTDSPEQVGGVDSSEVESIDKAELRKDYIEMKNNVEAILSKFKSKNPTVMKLLGQITNHLSDFLKKLS